MSLLEVKNLKKIYKTRFGGQSVEALKNVNFTVEEGEYVAIMGESGSGKTTLLNILAALDKATAGTVLLEGKDFSKIKESEVAAFRRDNLGFVFQEFNLLDTFSLEDNIYLPLVLAGKGYQEMHATLLHIAMSLGSAVMESILWILKLFSERLRQNELRESGSLYPYVRYAASHTELSLLEPRMFLRDEVH